MGSAGRAGAGVEPMITVSATGLELTPITSTERPWNVAEVVRDCRTKPDLP